MKIEWTMELLRESVKRMEPGTTLDPESIKSGFEFAFDELNNAMTQFHGAETKLLAVTTELNKLKSGVTNNKDNQKIYNQNQKK